MSKPPIPVVAVIGTGVIGRSWIRVFTRAGCETRIYDRDPEQVRRAVAWVRADLRQARQAKRIKKKAAKAEAARLVPCTTLSEALRGAGYVQESGPEQLAAKQALFAELDQVAESDAILASSTSAISMTEIVRGLAGADRCIVAHPINPPHLIPAVEVLAGEQTSAEVEQQTVEFLAGVGQSPVRMNRYVPGFVANRLQVALVREAIDLVARGVASVEAVDAAVRDGLGLRWAFMGPFAVANTNADQGVREYFTRFRDGFHTLWDNLDTSVRLDDALVERLGEATDRMTAGIPLADQREQRDRAIEELKAVKQALRRAARKRAKKKSKARNGTSKAKKSAGRGER
jgi:3-hydroxyacyl-CoA dehydrogenase